MYNFRLLISLYNSSISIKKNTYKIKKNYMNKHYNNKWNT